MKGVVVVGGALEQEPVGKSWAPPFAALAPVTNRPLITSAVDTLACSGADEVVVVGDRHAMPRLRSLLDGDASVDVTWLATDGDPSIGEALLHAAPVIAGHRLVVHTTSGLWLRGRGALVHALATSDLDALLFCRPARERAATAAGRGTAVGLMGTPGERAPLVHSGVFSFGPAILEALRGVEPDGRPPDLLDAVDLLERDGGRVEAAAADGWWEYTGAPEDLLDANYVALDDLDAPAGVHHATDSRVDGRVRIHPTARVQRSVLRGPAMIGAHATVVDAYVGPYTAIGDAATIENAEVEGSIVLTGAHLCDVGVRIESSIIGQGARVTRGFELPKAIRLLVGEDARVTLC